MLRPYQKRLHDAVTEILERSNKAVLNGTCGIGKTYIALSMVKNWVAKGKRVLIFTFSQNNIKKQWHDEIINRKIVKPAQFSVLCSQADVGDKDFKPGVSVTAKTYRSTPLLLTIPQTARNNIEIIGTFDYIVIDEAHNYLDIKDKGEGTLKRIIRGCSNTNTKILGLTATAFDIISGGGYFSDMPKENCIIYDVMEAVQNHNITNFDIWLVKFNFSIDSDMYREDGHLTRRGEVFVRSHIHSAKKVEDILCGVKGKTLVISLPMQDQAIYDYINMKFGNGSCVLNSQRNTWSDDAEKRFRSDSKCRFMVVINKCGVGWDFKELENVVDLTFTRSYQLIIQRMLRSCRNSDIIPNKVGNYFYCCDQSHSDDSIRNRIGYALWLSRREGIMAYRDQPGVDASHIFPKYKPCGEVSGNRINALNWMVESDIEYEKNIMSVISVTGQEPFIDELKRCIGMVPKGDFYAMKQKLIDICNISHDKNSFTDNLKKYNVMKGFK